MIFRYFLILFVLSLHAGGQSLSIAAIPDSLRLGADAVVRLDEGSFEIQDIDKAVYKRHRIISILNPEGRVHGHFFVQYDKLSKVSDLEYIIYDKNGDRIEKLKSSDFYDRTANMGYSLYEDNRFKWYESKPIGAYPYTVEYSYTIEYEFLYWIPSWFFQSAERLSVEKSHFELKYPPTIPARFKPTDFEGLVDSSRSVEDQIVKAWTVSGLKPIFLEPYSDSKLNQLPHLEFAPNQFEFEGYKGDMSSWNGYAGWIASLNADLDPLPKQFIDFLHEETRGLDELDKAKYIYEYLQKNSRYVSIQLGIGGFQPFSPALVHEMGYGDCKALSYYTLSMLDAVGVKAYYTLVSAGRDYKALDPDFPANSFNHAILCVPIEGDTLWMECTSQTNPFGYLGSFTGNRDVLLITEEGGKIARTPSIADSLNCQIRKVQLKVLNDGSAELREQTQFKGLNTESVANYLILNDREMDDFLAAYIEAPSFTINQKELKRIDDVNISLSLDYSTYKLFSQSGKRLFIQPDISYHGDFMPEENLDRQQDIWLNHANLELDSVIIEIPMGFKVESLFKSTQIQSVFGSYEVELKQLESGSLLYVRSLKLNSGRFSKESYSDFVRFFRAISNYDKKRFVLIAV